jgi:Ca2+:H+ antiporter
LHGRHSELLRAPNVLVAPVAHEDRPLGVDFKPLERRLEDRLVWLPLADLGGEDHDVEPLGETHSLEIAVEEPAGIEGVRDEAGAKAPATQAVEECVCVGAELPGRVPGGVLRLQEALELLVCKLDAEPCQELANHLGVLHLVHGAGNPEERHVPLAKAGCALVVSGELLAIQRRQTRRPAGLQQRLVVGEMEERVAPVEEDGVDHANAQGRFPAPLMRKILYALLVLGPVVVVLDRLGTGDVALFIAAATALIPLAWLIGEATEHAAHHTGAGIGGFLNATFGNAPELIIALFAVNQGLTEVVRGSLTGSVVGNLLLVLGFSLLFGGRGRIDRESSLTSLVLVAIAVLVFLVPAIPSWDGDPDRRSLAVLSLPVSIVLLVVYAVVTWLALRRHRQIHISDEPSEMEAWSFRVALAVLGAATVVTAFVAEILVHSLQEFGEQVGLSDFFLAAVVVAIVGNAAEHGGAVVVAYRGKIKLAAEIALASSAQVAVFLIPAVALLAWAIEPLALSFRPVELAAVGGSVVFATLLLLDGNSSRARGVALIAAYVGIAAAFLLAGER